MTSIERSEGNSYNHIKEPAYNILTYTWGRWQQKEGPRLPVEGVTWKIPSIREDHFSVSTLKSVLQQVAREVDYVWIDIACIDQENSAVKADEVGRQVGIFQEAQKVYAWLSWHTSEFLEELVKNVNDFSLDIQMSYLEGKADETYSAINSLTETLNMLFQDPWFSSLWTLQESFLRRDATLINQDAQTVPLEWSKTCPAQLGTLASSLVMAREALLRIIRGDALPATQSNTDTLARVNALSTIIENSGLYFLWANNPNLQYRVSQYRKCSRDVDRIYAIMQIYRLRLGQALEPHREFTRKELELQFIATLNAQNPVIAQAFVHTKIPGPGESYYITPAITVPERFRTVADFQAQCKISVQSTNEASFTGHACNFEAMLNFWDLNKHRQVDDPAMALAEFGVQSIFLDASSQSDSVSLYINVPYDREFVSRDVELKAFAAVQDFGRNVLDQFKSKELRILALGREVTRKGRQPVFLSLSQMGLILLREAGTPTSTWRRVGICLWSVPWADPENEPSWVKIEGRFG
ncbi:hypothetical protein MMC20_002396 [Loxospora ochrophaea]|nr:hypothetical protein [Loxospora ochrophaea]